MVKLASYTNKTPPFFQKGDDYSVSPAKQDNQGDLISLPFTCGAEPDCVNLLVAEKYTKDDKKFATSEIDFTVFDEELNKLGDQALYEKLSENPDLLNGQPTAISFKTSKDGTVIDNLYSIKEASTTLSAQEVLKNQLTANQAAIDGVWQQLAINDSLYALPNADTNLLDIQRLALKTQLSTLFSQKENLLSLVNNERLDAANELLSQNNLIVAANELQVANEKITNDIYFDTYARGNYHLNSNQLALIQSIANQCPIVGGRAVYAARSLYETIEPTMYDDNAICQAVGISQKTNVQNAETNNSFIIMPNPASKTISLQFNGFNDSSSEVLVYNAIGQVVSHINIPANAQIITADVSNLSSGMYWCQLVANAQTMSVQKLVIVK